MDAPIRVAVLGAGGLGRAAARLIGQKRELRLVAICDSKGLVASPDGLDCARIASGAGELVGSYRAADAQALVGATSSSREHHESSDRVEVVACEDPLGAMVERAGEFDAVLVTLPNMPNAFIPGTVERFVRANSGLVFVDVLKRTSAVERLLGMHELVRESEGVVLTGCGATPGLLTAAAVLAAQSFVEVERVDIWWGVGIANWEAYKATIREDIAHLPGFSVERAKAMSDAEVNAFLDKTHGVLELHEMEHADDILLERVGVVQSREQVTVGGVMDTRHARKPVSTTMTLTGITFEGKRASHRFILGDETTMAANVLGPALGYLKRAMWLKAHGIFGVFGSTEFMPMVVR